MLSDSEIRYDEEESLPVEIQPKGLSIAFLVITFIATVLLLAGLSMLVGIVATAIHGLAR